MDQQQNQPGDVLWGVDAFVRELFGELPKEEHDKKRRQVNHALANGNLPAVKAGRFWLGSRRRLHQFISE